MKRLFTAAFATETNTLSSNPTGYDDFARTLLIRAGLTDEPDGIWTTPIKVWKKRGREERLVHHEGVVTFAEPGGIVTKDTYRSFRTELINDLVRTLPMDIVLLGLHGAMVAEGCDDCEGDILEEVREVAGPDCIVGVLLDLHGHLTAKIVDNSSIIVAYKAYPHNDYGERAAELFDLALRAMRGEIKPVMATAPCHMMGLFPTTRGNAMPAYVQAMKDAEGKNDILSVSLLHSFPWADVPDAGAKTLVVADGSKRKAANLAKKLADRFWSIRDEAALKWVPMEEALDYASRHPDFPILLADTSDQVGGGAPGDSTYLLRAMLDRGMTDACFAPFWDPQAVYTCFQAGEGTEFRLRIGGKADARWSGQPVDLDVKVMDLFENGYQDGLNGEPTHHGRTARVRSGKLDILLTAERTNLYTPSLFSRHNIDILMKKYVCAKALYRYYDAMKPYCAEIILLATPGACNPDWKSLPLTRIPRPIWPLDQERPGG